FVLVLYSHVSRVLLIFKCFSYLFFALSTGEKMDFSQNVNISSHNYLCPNDWLLNQGKCYYFSTSFKTWKESQRDCTQLQAHLLVIQNLDELKFIQKSLKPGHFGWIGLHVTRVTSQGNLWMWIDERFLVPQLFSVIGPTDDRSCAVITGKQVYSEDCSSTFNGICQRDAILTHNRTSSV
uniref:Killer cell lectin like receptor F2 n=1 Tax=Saimiri boliviensis boliviensis TaxID=39432 RepID=A0A2K6UD28_SAIBB